MTGGAASQNRRRCIRTPPNPPEKPCADSERAQKWRLSLASLLFFTVLLSDRLWLCAAAGAQLRAQDRSVAQPEAAVRSGGGAAPTAEARLCPNQDLSSACGQPAAPPRPEAAAASSPDGAAPTAQPCLDLSSACSHRRLLQGPPGSAFSAAAPAEASPPQLAFLERHFRGLRLPFCQAYTVWDLLLGMAAAESLDCSLRSLLADVAAAAGGAQRGEACSSCLEAYQRLDQHAQEKYEEFEELLEKYLQAEDYSVRSCLRDCKAVYKAWLCSEYFNVTQLQCQHRIPCKQYCLEVQTRCPFVLPDNDELIYGGLPGFICTGLLERELPDQEAKCCDVRWDSCDRHLEGYRNASAKSEPFHDQHHNTPHNHQQRQQQHYNLYYHHTQYHHHHPSLLPVSAGSRLSNSKIRFCVLVLMLLHTMVSFSSVHSSGGLSLGAYPTMDETLARDE
ncbi:NALCN channel auxiliary factor 2 [Podarcis muralis]|uniref:NALCN channel auxiliary factor 2 n=1 Tax=Podarcis muralis TaxID=64176 RepID=A0A670KGS5_PODMU|nr:transmembrane protein FAM155B [Podarcis muralis]